MKGAEPHASTIPPTAANTQGVILAGGRGERLGGVDKALLKVAGKTLLSRSIAALRPQVGLLALSANGDSQRFAAAGIAIWCDEAEAEPDHQPRPPQGPLAGIRAALNRTTLPWLLIAPVDAPQLPQDLFARLAAATLAPCPRVLRTSRGLEPLLALVPTLERDALDAAWCNGERSPLHWLLSRGAIAVDFDVPAWALSLNTARDLAEAERHLP